MEPVERKAHYLHLEARGAVRVLGGLLALMGAFGIAVMASADIPKSLVFWIVLAIAAVGVVVIGLIAVKGRILLPYKREEKKPLE